MSNILNYVLIFLPISVPTLSFAICAMGYVRKVTIFLALLNNWWVIGHYLFGFSLGHSSFFSTFILFFSGFSFTIWIAKISILLFFSYQATKLPRKNCMSFTISSYVVSLAYSFTKIFSGRYRLFNSSWR